MVDHRAEVSLESSPPTVTFPRIYNAAAESRGSSARGWPGVAPGLPRRPAVRVLHRARRAGRPGGQRPGRPGRPARTAGDARDARHRRFPGRVPGSHAPGRRRGPGQHPAHRSRLRVHARRQPRPRRGHQRHPGREGARRRVPARIPAEDRGRELARRTRPRRRRSAARRPPRGREPRAASRRHHPRRSVRSGCTLRGRPASPRPPCICTPIRCRPRPCMPAAVLGIARRRRGVLGGQAVLRLRPGQRADVPALGRCDRGARAPHARRPPPCAAMHARARSRPSSAACPRCSRHCSPTRHSCATGRRPDCGCAPRRARRLPRHVGEAGKPASAPTSSTASARPRCCTSSCRNRPGDVHYGTSGRPVPGYDLELRGDDGEPVARRRGRRRCGCAGRPAASRYWNDRERSLATFHGAVDAHRRSLHASRRRLDLRRPRRRHAQGRRDLGVAVRGRVGARRPPRGARGRRGRRSRRRRARQAEGVRGPASAGAARRRLADELKAFVKATLAPYKYPRWIEFVAELPKTATGKIQRYRLR